MDAESVGIGQSRNGSVVGLKMMGKIVDLNVKTEATWSRQTVEVA